MSSKGKREPEKTAFNFLDQNVAIISILVQNGDKCFLNGDIRAASFWYCEALKLKTNSSESFDELEKRNLEWGNSFLNTHLAETEKFLILNKGESSYHHKKASILILQNDWSKAQAALKHGIICCKENSHLIAMLKEIERLEPKTLSK